MLLSGRGVETMKIRGLQDGLAGPDSNMGMFCYCDDVEEGNQLSVETG
jgi:hypothetical protein